MQSPNEKIVGTIERQHDGHDIVRKGMSTNLPGIHAYCTKPGVRATLVRANKDGLMTYIRCAINTEISIITAGTWQLALVWLTIVVAQHGVPDNCYGLRLRVDQLCGGATAKVAVV